MAPNIPDHDGDETNSDEKLFWNGIDAATGAYLFDPMTSAELAAVAQGKAIEKKGEDKEHLADLKFRAEKSGQAHYGVKEGIDNSKLEQTGWGVIFPAVKAGSDEEKEQAAIYEALLPLLSLRRSQAGKIKEQYYREYRGALGYRAGETKQQYLGRLGVGPGPADPDKVPYYLLIVASPQVIPYHVQYQIDVQYAVGRIHFDTIEEYANYARSVVLAETGGLALNREIAFLGVSNADDMATQLSRKNLVGPLADIVENLKDVPGWKVARYFDEQANKATAGRLLGGSQTPALLFSGSHGMGFGKSHDLQERRQGALLLQDWPGPKEWRQAISDDFYFSGDDVSSDANLLGLISFNFACYGAGTPEHDEFSKQAFKERKPIADRAFVAGLHRKLLGHPKGGALAAIGHVERAWGYSFMWGTGRKGAQEAQLAVFESTIKALMKGLPVGAALEYFNQRYAELASDLSREIEEIEYGQPVDAFNLANMWTSNNDARGYAIVGDPAVRLQFASGDGAGHARETLHLTGSAKTTPETTASATAQQVEQGSSRAIASPDKPALPPAAAVDFSLFGGSDKTAEDGTVKVNMFQDFVAKVVGTLGKAITDAVTLEVRTYVSSNTNAAASADRNALNQFGELRAFTRIRIDGDMDVVVPERDGAVDTALFGLHLEMVKQAQQNRAEMVKTILSAISGLIKL